MTKRVAILTGGGDVPGLNMCLKSLVYRVIDLGFEPIGVRKGWHGLINYNPSDPSTYSEHFLELTKNIVRPIDRTPGSFLHNSRLDPRHTPREWVPEFLRKAKAESQDMTEHIKEVVHRLGYRALIIIGDGETLNYAAYLSELGVPIIGIPKTIHNNINGTDYTLGFSTGLARGVAFIHELRALAGSREHIMVVETFAGKSGYGALLMALMSGADRTIIPEVPYDPEKLAYLVMLDKHQTPANYATVIVCDGAQVEASKAEKYAHLLLPKSRFEAALASHEEEHFFGPRLVGSGMVAAELLGHITQEGVMLQPLTYMMRTGSPDGQDLLGGTNFAFTAARLLTQGKYGRMTAFIQNKMWTDVALSLAADGVKTVDTNAWYDAETYQPKLNLIWSAENE